MKKSMMLMLLTLLCTITVAKDKVVNAPYFASRNTTEMEITKVVLTSKSTILYVQLVSHEGKAVNIQNSSTLTVGEKSFKMTRKTNLPEEGFVKIPAEGYIETRLYFEPIPMDATSFNFSEGGEDGWTINQVYLDGTKPQPTIPESILKKHYDAVPLPTPQPAFGEITISGKLYGNLAGARPTIRYFIQNWVYWAFMPVNIKIADDGTFEYKDLVMCAGLKKMMIGSKTFYIFVAPGSKTMINIDLVGLIYSGTKMFAKDYKDKQQIYFDGDYALLNNELITKNYSGDFASKFENVYTMSANELKAKILNQYKSDYAALQTDKTVSEPYRQLMSAELTAAAFAEGNSAPYIIGYASHKSGEKRGDITKGKDFDNDLFSISGIESPRMMQTTHYGVILDSFWKNHPERMSAIAHQIRQDELTIKKTFSRLSGQQVLNAKQLAVTDSVQTPVIKQYILAKDEQNKAEIKEAVRRSADIDIKTLDASVMGKDILPAVIKSHKGKAILIDFWATWCGPCMRAMKTILPIKDELKDKEIIYIYLTGETSPELDWRKAIVDIHGEHYRLSNAQWNDICKEYSFEGIPAYLIIDRNGKVIHQHIGFPGEAVMKQELLDASK